MNYTNKTPLKDKNNLHPRNRHNGSYNFDLLINSSSELSQFVRPNLYNVDSIDFFNPKAVKALNKALLKQFYSIDWDIPDDFLCPPIPGRADYIHHIADLLGGSYRSIPKGNHIKCIDVGTGANCIYPIIGATTYQWTFMASDIDEKALLSAKNICKNNSELLKPVHTRLQVSPRNFFKGIIKRGELYEVTICNPPFHKSLKEAQEGTLRKLKNLKGEKNPKTVLNFGGQHNELWCKGGEKKFIKDMIFESRRFGSSCLWFTTLVSKEANLNSIYDALKKVEAITVKTIPMGQGNKKSRIVAWSFLNNEEQQKWIQSKNKS